MRRSPERPTSRPAVVSGRAPSLLGLAWACFHIGLVGYGGPAIIAYTKRVFVGSKGWATDDEFLTGLSLVQMVPGATGLNLITYLAYQLRGVSGALIAATAFLTPAFGFMTIASAVYFRVGQLPVARALFTGLGAVVVALLANAVLVLGRSAVKDARGAGIAAAALALSVAAHAPTLVIVAIDGLLGVAAYCWLRPPGVQETVPAKSTGAAGRTSAAAWVAVALVALWLGVLFALRAMGSEAAAMALGVSKVGTVAFGGGFNVIGPLHEQVAMANKFVTEHQFTDGLALGQVTPGPILITAVFVGYRVAGLWGALLGGLGMFGPSTAITLAVSPHSEKLRTNRVLQAAVRGVVAGFIGVLIGVTWRLGVQSVVDWRTATMALASAGLLIVAKVDTPWVVLGAAIVSVFVF